MRQAVVLGVNYYIGLSVVRCLGRQGIYVVAADYDHDAYGLRSRYVSHPLLLTDYKDDPHAMVRGLIEYAKTLADKPVLFPCHDNYVKLIDDYFRELKPYFLFPQEIEGLGTKCCDKHTLAMLAREHGVLIPPSLPLDPSDDFADKVERDIGYPCIIKPDDSTAFVSHFRHKVMLVNNRDDLLTKTEQVRKAGFTAQIQKVIRGFDDHMYTYDAYVNREGRVSHMMTCQKKRQWPINFGASTFIVQQYVPALHEIGAPFLESIGWRGFAEIEFKREEGTENYYLIEINTRTTNFNAMIERCGINMPYVCYCEMDGKPLADRLITTNTKEAFRYRYEDLFAKRRYRKTGQLTRSQLREQERGYHVTEALFARDDLRPWLVFWWRALKKFFGRLFKRS